MVIAGQGEARPGLEALARDLGIERNVHFVGVRRDREHLYGAFDTFVLPSRWEGLSLALAEAVGAGIPTVATDVGGNREVIEPDCTGLLVPLEMIPPRWRWHQKDFLGDAELRRRLSERGIAHVRPRFGIDRHVHQLDALYTHALAS